MEEALRRPRRMRPPRTSVAAHHDLGSRESSLAPHLGYGWRIPFNLMLDRFIHYSDRDVEGTASETSYTCTGRPIRASLRAAHPPAISRLYLHWPGRKEVEGLSEPQVVAAHGHSIVFRAEVPFEDTADRHLCPMDLFVYSAFSSPPSLIRLPPCFTGGISIPEEDIFFEPYTCRQQRTMLKTEMGLLCHGDKGDFTVVDFTFIDPNPELCLLHCQAPAAVSRSILGEVEVEKIEWRIKKVRLPKGPKVGSWITDTIVPVNGRLLWVDSYQGILVVDVHLANDLSCAEEELQLGYIPLPIEALQSGHRLYPHEDVPDPARSVGLTPMGEIILVCIIPGEIGQGCSPFTITSWIRCNFGIGEWYKAYTMHHTEFWGLYHGRSLPVVKPMYPLVSLVHPRTISFLLEDERSTYWMVEFDMRKRVLTSSAVYINEEEEEEEGCTTERDCRNFFQGHSFIPSKIFSYLGKNASISLKLSEMMQKAKQSRVEEKRRLDEEKKKKEADAAPSKKFVAGLKHKKEEKRWGTTKCHA